MSENSQAVMINSDHIPDAEAAVADFESNGGHLTVFSAFGEDPLQQNPLLIAQREAEFCRVFPTFSDIFHNVVNGDFYLFREGLLCFIDISERLSSHS